LRHYGRVPDTTALRLGDPQEVAGYRVLSRLGSGGQGVVYLAEAPSGDRVAIKQLRFDPEDARAREQFAKEVAAARLVAPFCTAQVLDAEVDGPMPYVISEFIEGPSLQQRIDEQGPMSGAALQRLAIGTITALAAIHQVGVVHRDFKPANVMLAVDGPRVIDFGVARDMSMDTTVTSRVFGTPAYMAPEQLRGERIGPATDLFSWASVMAFAATGLAPFEAPHVAAVMHRVSSSEPDLTGVPDDLLGVLTACLAKDPAARPTAQQTLALLLGRPLPAPSDASRVLADATDLVHAAATAATSGAGPAPASPAENPAPPTGGRGRLLGVAALVLAVAIGGTWALARTGLLSGGPKESTGIISSATGIPATDDPSSSGTPTPSAPVTSPAPAPGNNALSATIPSSFEGDWRGEVRVDDPKAEPFEVRVDLKAGASEAELDVVGLGCSGPLIALLASDRYLEFRSLIDDDPQDRCFDKATLKLVKIGDSLNYEWIPDRRIDRTSSGYLEQD
jgi:serine/threonine protein kinase